MAETYTQLAPNSTGNKIRELETTVGSNTVRQQGVFQAARESYMAVVESCAFANSKKHLTVYNGSGSGKVIRLQKLFVTNMIETTITGGARRLDVKKVTSCSGGTDITPVPHDSTNATVPSQIIIQTGATATEGALLFPMVLSTDEMLLNQNSMTQQFMAGVNWIPEGYEIEEYVLREGEGFTIKQITNDAVGVVTWILVFSMEGA